MKKIWRETISFFLIVGVTAAFMWFLLYAPTPYVLYEPGLALHASSVLRPMTAQAAHMDGPSGEAGFYLTTVRMSEPNYWQVFMACLKDKGGLKQRHHVMEHQTRTQYSYRQYQEMRSSNTEAVEAAYRKLRIAYRIDANGRPIATAERHRLTADSDKIGGPSAGLALSLQAIDTLTGGELSGGLKIAATGTIKADGSVGRIGGIAQKVRGAIAAEVDLFIVPYSNYSEVLSTFKDKKENNLHIIPVASLDDAVEKINVYHKYKEKQKALQAAQSTRT